MSQIKQMQMRFVPAEDRLLFAMHTHDNAEFQFWLTRRYVKLLWPILQRTLENIADPVTPKRNDPVHKRAMMSFRHEQALLNADFQTPYQPATQTHKPLGETPILAAKVGLRPKEDNPCQFILSLHPEQGKGLDINLDTRLLHTFCQLLIQSTQGSDWGLNVQMQAPARAPLEKRLVN
jgi:hypothetical protein